MPTPFRSDDLFLHRTVAAIDCAPGVDRALGAIGSIDRDGDATRSTLWTFALDGSGGGPLPCSDGSDTSPRWSPSGDRFAFLSTRSGSKQIHVAPADGSRVEQVGAFASGAMAMRWLPDGSGFVATAAVVVAPDWRGARASRPAPPRRANAPEVAWRLPYKEDGIGYLLQREIHLFRLDLATGQERRLTDGAFDVYGFDVSRDGGRVAYVRTGEGRAAHRYDLWVLDLADGTHRRLTDRHAMAIQPAWSPDGTRIAFTGAVVEGDAESRLWVVDVASGAVEEIGGDDVDVADPTTVRWSDDGRSLTFVRAWHGRHRIAVLPAGGGRPEVLVGGDRQFAAMAVADDRFVYAVDAPTQPCEVWACDRRGGGEARLSDLNPWWAERTPLALEARTFDVPDGSGGTERVEGWLLRAAGGTGAPGPLLDDMHGGPAAYALLDYASNVFWQVLCSRGWTVLALNAVGSATYGRAFCGRLSGRWGELDLPQHIAAIEQLKADGVCDGRVAVSGKSYGGYLASWATGHTDTLRAAVVMAPVGNLETHYGTSDGGFYADPFYIGTQPAFDRAVARRLSPLQSIERSTTPTLFLTGKEDERCPKCQAEELFVSLYRAGDTPAELVLYPGESHGFLGTGRPSCRQDASDRIVAWLEAHTGTEGSA